MADTTLESDPFKLERFLIGQSKNYADAFAEISEGCKRTHWMWYIFPQMAGLAFSEIARHYGITSAAEARAYLDHPVLGVRLRACAEAVMKVSDRSAHDIFGTPDDLKLRSCATLFSAIEPTGSVFHQIIDKYYGGKPDDRTLGFLRMEQPA